MESLSRLSARFSLPTPSILLRRWLLPAALLLVVLAAGPHAQARRARNLETATVVETAEYTPCGLRCSPDARPARAFCLRSGTQTLVGENRSYFHEAKMTGMEDYGGQQVEIHFNHRWIWMTAADGTVTRIVRGSEYEGFKDRGCVAAVNRPILARANAKKRPSSVPASAIAIAGPEQGEDPQPFLWYACAAEPQDGSIRCRRWYQDGGVYGDDWYCARTLDGKAVAPDFSLDAVESDANHLVLASGGVLEHDQRSRVAGKLDPPGAKCF